jgi:hypothetical protein
MRHMLATLALILAAPVWADTTLQIKGGETRLIPGTDLAVRVIHILDQRCPADLECYWEGMIEVHLALIEPDLEPMEVILCNACEDGPNTTSQGGVTLMLKALSPARTVLDKLGREPVLGDYSVDLSVVTQ